MENFDSLPLVTEGESKIIRYLGNGMTVIKYKPTIYSFTHNRAGNIPGTDFLRLQASKIFLKVLADAGISHAYKSVDLENKIVTSQLILERKINNGKEQYSFFPTDIEYQECLTQPPIEVVVKKYHVGTPKHRYYQMDKYRVRDGLRSRHVSVNERYPNGYIVRFDWRNPLYDKDGSRLADECMPEDLADLYINTKKAKETAINAFLCLDNFLTQRQIEIQDICFLITSDGTTIFSEISQDCGRFVYNGDSLDKDVWRAGGSGNKVVEKWEKILELIG